MMWMHIYIYIEREREMYVCVYGVYPLALAGHTAVRMKSRIRDKVSGIQVLKYSSTSGKYK